MDREEGQDTFLQEIRNTIARYRAEGVLDFVDTLGCLELIKADLLYEATEYEVTFHPEEENDEETEEE